MARKFFVRLESLGGENCQAGKPDLHQARNPDLQKAAHHRHILVPGRGWALAVDSPAKRAARVRSREHPFISRTRENAASPAGHGLRATVGGR